MGLSLSAIREYLPCLATKPATFNQNGVLGVDELKVLSRAAIAAAGTAVLSKVILGTFNYLANPSDYYQSYERVFPGFAATICFALLYNRSSPKADLYAEAKSVSRKTMKEFIDQPSLLSKVLKKAENDPSILLKMNESGTTLLTEFISAADLRFPSPQSADRLYSKTEMSSYHIVYNMNTLKKLLLAVDWPKDELPFA